MLRSVAFSVMRRSSLNLLPAAGLTHCAPTTGVTDTLGTGPLAKSTGPCMVVALSVLMALASAALSRGLVLALSAAVPASNSDMVEPSICVHCLQGPVDFAKGP